MKASPPGKRFEHHYRRNHQGGPRKPVLIGLGVLMIVGGFVLGFVPGIPGIVLAVLGAAMISNESLAVARAFDRMERWIRARF